QAVTAELAASPTGSRSPGPWRGRRAPSSGPRAGLAANRRRARVILDGGFREFRRRLDYKARRSGAAVVVANRWFPSSKTCACCGSVKAGVALSQRIFTCDTCGYAADRDLNAARNLERPAASSAVTAYGEERSGAGRKPRVKRISAKQAPDSRAAA
ncbi:zinc ribbon domain-containing protein, partial [Phenylobacterium sp.]|uniref:zinc ribbon domain-containing protein n=1 Tax=Phenylobacterium sp. TaxID=1871053 RepID=UPI002F4249F1